MNSLLILLLLPLLLLNSLTNATYPSTNFIQCLNSQANFNLSNIIFTPTNPSYTPILQEYIKNSRFNSTTTPKPLLIVAPLVPSHVQSTVICAKAAHLQLKIRSGGHDYEGISYTSSNPNFILLDLFNFRNVTVDIEAGTAYAQAGAQMGELYYKIWSESKVHAFPGGVCPTLGVGGHISGGGYGNMLRKFGLSVDNLVDAEIVDVSGRLLDRKSMGDDLFWAISGGGGGSFGVILSYTVKLAKVPANVTVFSLPKTLGQNATDIVYRWQFVSSTIDNRLFIRLLLQPSSETVKATFIGLFLGDANELLTIVNKDFPQLGLKSSDCKEMSWIESVLFWANLDVTNPPEILLNRHSDTVGFGKRKSDYVTTQIPKPNLDLIFKKLMELGKVGLVFNPYGGKMSEIPATATPFPHRQGYLWKMQYSVNWKNSSVELEKSYLKQARDMYTFMTPYVSQNPRGSFLNYRDLDIGINSDSGKNSYREGKIFGEKYFGVNFDRLVKIKTRVDPDNFFRNEQSIPTLEQGI